MRRSKQHSNNLTSLRPDVVWSCAGNRHCKTVRGFGSVLSRHIPGLENPPKVSCRSSAWLRHHKLLWARLIQMLQVKNFCLRPT